MKIKFINIEDDEKGFLSSKLLYKIMPLEYALSALNTNSLWFTKPETWKDPFEKRFIDNYYSIGGKTRQFPWKNKVFCTCMSNVYGSEAQWAAYKKGDIALTFKIKRDVLLDELKNYANNNNAKVFIGKVEYQKTSYIKQKISENEFINPTLKPINNLNNDEIKAKLLLLKRNAFSYENEYRIIIVKNNITKENGFKMVYNCKNNEIFDSIALDPNIQDNTYELLKDVLSNKYNFSPVHTRKGLRNRIVRSLLYRNMLGEIIKV